MMHEISFWRRHRGLLTIGLVVVLLSLIGSCIVVVHERTQVPLGQVCGDLTVRPDGDYVAAQRGTVRQVEQCFIQAYHQCQNASMLVAWFGTDTYSNETFTIEPQNGHCQIISSSQGHGVGNDGLVGLLRAHTITTQICQGLTLTTNSLILKPCENGDTLIPRTEHCGAVSHGYGVGNIKQAEDCFMQDKLQCYPAVLSSFESGSERASHVFQIDGSCKIILKVDMSFNSPDEVMCIGMTQQADGLHFQGCGSTREILVPVNP